MISPRLSHRAGTHSALTRVLFFLLWGHCKERRASGPNGRHLPHDSGSDGMLGLALEQLGLAFGMFNRKLTFSKRGINGHRHSHNLSPAVGVGVDAQ